jgi:hypothetical protein
MSRMFSPDYGALSTKHGYRPMHSWFADEKLKLTPIKSGPTHFPTFSQARAFAKEYVAQQINGRDRSIVIDVDPAIPDFLDPEAWNRERAARQAEEQQGAFGTVFVRHKPVKVEHVKRRARA